MKKGYRRINRFKIISLSLFRSRSDYNTNEALINRIVAVCASFNSRMKINAATQTADAARIQLATARFLTGTHAKISLSLFNQTREALRKKERRNEEMPHGTIHHWFSLSSMTFYFKSTSNCGREKNL